MHYFSNLFWYSTLHVSDRYTVHHQKSQHCIQSNRCLSYYFCWLSASDSYQTVNRTSMTNTYCVYIQCCDTPDDGQWTCPKHEECFTKINLKIVHLVGFYYKNISQCTALWMSNSTIIYVTFRILLPKGLLRCRGRDGKILATKGTENLVQLCIYKPQSKTKTKKALEREF
jgi:hypothetical protein